MLVALTLVSPLVMLGLLMGLARVEHWLDGPGAGPEPPRTPVVLVLPTPRTPLDADLGAVRRTVVLPAPAAVVPEVPAARAAGD
jgi:hypothetical protein